LPLTIWLVIALHPILPFPSAASSANSPAACGSFGSTPPSLSPPTVPLPIAALNLARLPS
jgi:hypothetical protein